MRHYFDEISATLLARRAALGRPMTRLRSMFAPSGNYETADVLLADALSSDVSVMVTMSFGLLIEGKRQRSDTSIVFASIVNLASLGILDAALIQAESVPA